MFRAGPGISKMCFKVVIIIAKVSENTVLRDRPSAFIRSLNSAE